MQLRSLLFQISVFIFSVTFFIEVKAQKSYLPSTLWGYKYQNLDRMISDTLDSHFDSATATVYTSPNGGFVSGNSGYNEIAKGQEFPVDSTSFTVEGFLYWFAYKEQQSLNSDSSSLTLTFWKMDSSSVINSITRLIPRTKFDSSPLYIKDIDTSYLFANGVNVWMVTPTIVYNNFMAGFTMENLHVKDTIALFSSSNGDAPIPTLSWEKWNNVWTPIYYSWGLDIDFAIFPLVDNLTAGIESEQYFQNLKMSFYPNPTQDNLIIDYANDQKGEIDILIYNSEGKTVYHKNLGVQLPGQYQSSINVQFLSEGLYFISLGINGNQRISKKLVITD